MPAKNATCLKTKNIVCRYSVGLPGSPSKQKIGKTRKNKRARSPTLGSHFNPRNTGVLRIVATWQQKKNPKVPCGSEKLLIHFGRFFAATSLPISNISGFFLLLRPVFYPVAAAIVWELRSFSFWQLLPSWHLDPCTEMGPLRFMLPYLLERLPPWSLPRIRMTKLNLSRGVDSDNSGAWYSRVSVYVLFSKSTQKRESSNFHCVVLVLCTGFPSSSSWWVLSRLSFSGSSLAFSRSPYAAPPLVLSRVMFSERYRREVNNARSRMGVLLDRYRGRYNLVGNISSKKFPSLTCNLEQGQRQDRKGKGWEGHGVEIIKTRLDVTQEEECLLLSLSIFFRLFLLAIARISQVRQSCRWNQSFPSPRIAFHWLVLRPARTRPLHLRDGLANRRNRPFSFPRFHLGGYGETKSWNQEIKFIADRLSVGALL